MPRARVFQVAAEAFSAKRATPKLGNPAKTREDFDQAAVAWWLIGGRWAEFPRAKTKKHSIGPHAVFKLSGSPIQCIVKSIEPSWKRKKGGSTDPLPPRGRKPDPSAELVPLNRGACRDSLHREKNYPGPKNYQS